MIHQMDTEKKSINIRFVKTFDTLKHGILIHKLNFYAVKGSDIKLLTIQLS